MDELQALLSELNLSSGVNWDWFIYLISKTGNSRLATLCRHANIPTISIHGLRHTHASLLLFQGVSVLSVSQRLGHANVTTTQETYLHIIKELETKDNRKILKHLKEL